MWIRFWIETNARWGWVESPEEWEDFVEKYSIWVNKFPEEGRKHLLDMCKQTSWGSNNFGLYEEHIGKTLREFFEENNMNTGEKDNDKIKV